jgi:hypothetical protein
VNCISTLYGLATYTVIWLGSPCIGRDFVQIHRAPGKSYSYAYKLEKKNSGLMHFNTKEFHKIFREFETLEILFTQIF